MNKGTRDILYRNRTFFIPYLIILCACLVIKILYTRPQIYLAVNSVYSNWADAAAPYITDMGEGYTILGLSVLLVLFNYRAAFLLASSYAAASLVAQILKYSFALPRPSAYFAGQNIHMHVVEGVYLLAKRSFPSGHTVAAFSAGMALCYLVKSKMWGPLLLAAALLIGYSRMYLSQHFFEDVMAGSVIGVFVTVAWLAFIDKKKFINSPCWRQGLIKSIRS